MGGVPLVAVWAAVGIMAQRGRSLVAGSETRAVEQMISLARRDTVNSGFFGVFDLVAARRRTDLLPGS